jgi:hypothetical protein
VARIELSGDLERALAPVVAADMEGRADAVLAEARRTAPVDTGEYRASLRMERIPGGGWRVVADCDHGAVVEFGTRDQHAHRTLLNALKEATDQ